jgi:hypothetical protein
MNTTTDKFAVEAEFGGMFRVTHYRNGSMVNRRRDVSPQRVEAVKEALLRETKDAS